MVNFSCLLTQRSIPGAPKATGAARKIISTSIFRIRLVSDVSGLTNISDRSLVVRPAIRPRSEEHTSELQSQSNLVCRLLLEKKKKQIHTNPTNIQLNSNQRQTAHPVRSSKQTPF